MKKILISIFALTSILTYGQHNTNWTYNTSHQTNQGYVGIGTRASALGGPNNNAPLPNFNLQLHGTFDYLFDPTATPEYPSGLALLGMEADLYSNEKIAINYGKTARFGMTNSSVGNLETDGFLFRYSEKNMIMFNQEGGNVTLSTSGNTPTTGNINIATTNIGMNFSGQNGAIFVNSNSSSMPVFGRFNVLADINNSGMHIRSLTQNPAKFGFRVTVSEKVDAIQVFGVASTTNKVFKVDGLGRVYARQYTTTVTNIPDYVFQPEYKLMPIDELKTYVKVNSHLPNIPSAKEIESKDGEVDLGEMNRLLLEKTEELTLYIFQLEERLKSLEEKK